jgi:hypothetical protein
MKVPVCFDLYYLINGSSIEDDLIFVISIVNYLKEKAPSGFQGSSLKYYFDMLLYCISEKDYERLRNSIFTNIPENSIEQLSLILQRAYVMSRLIHKKYDYLDRTTEIGKFFHSLIRIIEYLNRTKLLTA